MSIKIIGHRGARGLAPENTLAGLEKGLEHHVDQLEIDVRMTKDGVAVLHHNAELEEGGTKLRIRDRTYEQLKAGKSDLATLAEAIAFVKRRVPIIIEVSPRNRPQRRSQSSAASSGKAGSRRISRSSHFDFPILKELHAAFPEHTMIVDEMWSGVRATWRARRLGSKEISLYTPILWTGFIRMVSRRGYHVYAFPLNDPAKARKWAKAGFYGAVTDFPDRFEQ
ncbi:MAG: glycerophosphodiester phosphodiesterase [Candidatus Saccharibacteria bacterium]